MTTDHRDDEALRRWFRAQAADEEPLAPSFGLPRATRDRPSLVGWVPAAVAATLVLVAGALWLGRAANDGVPPYPIDLATVSWTSPTDFLLETPGRALLREVPGFQIRDWPSLGLSPDVTDDTAPRSRT